MNRPDDDFEPLWVAGFMSGTSLDAVDAALIRTDGLKVQDFGPVAERKFSPGERSVLKAAVDAARAWNWQGRRPDTAFAAAIHVLTDAHLEAWQNLVQGWAGPPIALAGVHGQTVLHRRPASGRKGATLQILDAPAVQSGFGVPLIHDFRSADVEAGGEGAPLAPAYHAALMDRLGEDHTVFLNLGGVANITARQDSGGLVAFDTGPANGPIDEWVSQSGHGTHDKDGAIAASGRVDEALLSSLLEHPYFQAPPPKSLDRYDFTASLVDALGLEDGAATLTAFSAHSVAKGLDWLDRKPRRIIACGGGRHNPTLMAMLADALKCQLKTAEQAGLRGDSIEAEAFAFLAVRAMRGLDISWPETTGIPAPMTGGRRLVQGHK